MKLKTNKIDKLIKIEQFRSMKGRHKQRGYWHINVDNNLRKQLVQYNHMSQCCVDVRQTRVRHWTRIRSFVTQKS